jgi:hypothetical protein
VINAEAAEIVRAEIAEKDRGRLNAISGRIVDAAMRVHTLRVAAAQAAAGEKLQIDGGRTK